MSKTKAAAAPAEYRTFSAQHQSPADARAYLGQIRGMDAPPPGYDLSEVAKSVAEAQALAGEPHDPLIKHPLGAVADQQRWYDIVRERMP